jgi:hypothetical protein
MLYINWYLTNGTLEDAFYDIFDPILNGNTSDGSNITLADFLDGNGSISFTECGKHMCYPGHECITRKRTDFVTDSIHILNYTQALENAILYAMDHPEFDEMWIQNLTENSQSNLSLCDAYNQTYLDELVDGGASLAQISEVIPSECMVLKKIIKTIEHPVGCCPQNTVPCGASRHSFYHGMHPDWPQGHSIESPLVGCAGDGESCCGSAGVCSVGYKCCHNIPRYDGSLPHSYPDEEVSSLGIRTFTREALDVTLLPPNRTVSGGYIKLDDINSEPMCCPTWATCCQGVDSPWPKNSFLHGDIHTFYCSLDPYCLFPINFAGGGHVLENGLRINLGGHPALQFGHPGMDYDSDGTFDLAKDIFETFLQRPPRASILTPDYVDYRNNKFPFSLSDQYVSDTSTSTVAFYAQSSKKDYTCEAYSCQAYYGSTQDAHHSAFNCDTEIRNGAPGRSVENDYITIQACGKNLTIPAPGKSIIGARTPNGFFYPWARDPTEILFITGCLNISLPGMEPWSEEFP